MESTNTHNPSPLGVAKHLLRNVPSEKVIYRNLPTAPEGYCPFCKMDDDILVKCILTQEDRTLLSFATGNWETTPDVPCYTCPNKCGWSHPISN